MTYQELRERYPGGIEYLYGAQTATTDAIQRYPTEAYATLAEAIARIVNKLPGYRVEAYARPDGTCHVVITSGYMPGFKYVHEVNDRGVAEWLHYGEEYYPAQVAHRIVYNLINSLLGPVPPANPLKTI